MNQHLHVFASRPELNRGVAEAVVRLAQQSVTAHGAFHIALAGGSTPRDIYAYLAQEPLREAMPWPKVHVYFGDERTVPPHHEQSNFGMAHAALLSRVPIPAQQIHRMQGEDSDPQTAAVRYEQTLRSHLPSVNRWPRLDLVLLGVGTDGHIASLFPDTKALHVMNRAVTAVHVAKLNTWRITVTFPVLNHAKEIFVIAAGEEKAPIIKTALDVNASVHYPVQQLRDASHVEWFLDAGAAAQLTDII